MKKRTKRRTYPGCLDRRGYGFRWRVLVDGTHYTYTFRTLDRAEAGRAARSEYAKLAAHADRRQKGLPGRVRLSALFDEFERDGLPAVSPGTQRSYRDSLKPLRTYFTDHRANPYVDEIRAGDVEGYMTWRRSHRVGGGTVSNRTIGKDRAVLHVIFEMAETHEYRDGNPVARTKAPKHDGRDPVILSDGEYEQLLDACEGRPILWLYVLALGETGARCESEVLWLRWEDIDLEEGFLQVVSGRNGHRTKGGKTRWVPMTSRLRQAMRDHFAAYRFATYKGEQVPWVFHHVQTRRHHKAGERIRSLYGAFKNAAKRAELSADLVQHDLRHRRVTAWLADGKDVVKVKEAVGHSDLRTTMGYTHLVREHLRVLVTEDLHVTPAKNLA